MICSIKTLIVDYILRLKFIRQEIQSVKFSITESHASEIQKLTESHASEIQKLTESHASEIQKLTESHASEIQKVETEYSQDSLLKIVQPTFDTKITYLTKKESNELDDLCEKYGTDKGYTSLTKHPYSWIPHNYSAYYSQIFSAYRLENINVFECGIGTNNPNLPSNMTENGKPGASLRVWREYFPNALIFGADIDNEILFQEDRITTDYMDQLNMKSIDLYFEKLGDIKFDIMIDDGLHTFESSLNLFERSINYLSDTGIYVIEDVFPSDFHRFCEYFTQFDYCVEFIVLENCDRTSLHDNCLISVSKKQSSTFSR
jgi:hypothetical protein